MPQNCCLLQTELIMYLFGKTFWRLGLHQHTQSTNQLSIDRFKSAYLESDMFILATNHYLKKATFFCSDLTPKKVTQVKVFRNDTHMLIL